jgi:hypothetical protein
MERHALIRIFECLSSKEEELFLLFVGRGDKFGLCNVKCCLWNKNNIKLYRNPTNTEE